LEKNVKRNQTLDDVIDRALFGARKARENRKEKRDSFLAAQKTLKPDFSQSRSDLAPIEGKFPHHIMGGRTSFEEPKKPEKSELTLNDIIDRFLFPEKRAKAHSGIRAELKDIRANVSPEVREYWLEKIGISAQKRGKLYKESTGYIGEQRAKAQPDVAKRMSEIVKGE
jgi:hypothetical protein